MKFVLMTFAAMLAGSGYFSNSAAETEPAGSGTAAQCVHWKSEARWVGYGYNHLVHLDNQCKQVKRCTVTTDVNPKPIITDLEPAEKETVLTYKGSPASKFKASVDCKEK